VTTEGVTALDATAPADDDQLFCYRHPARETRIRCGRCDRPICTRCAMQGPVGFRCKTCGTLANDPLTTVRPMQGLLGVGIALALGLVAAFIAGRIGFFSIIVSFIAGGFVAEAVTRVIGWKRGATILVIVLGGIIAGHAVGFGVDYVLNWSHIVAIEGQIAEQLGLPTSLFFDNLMWAVLSAGAACVGAYTRLR
jgi:hypothetical protein